MEPGIILLIYKYTHVCVMILFGYFFFQNVTVFLCVVRNVI